ncbi:hypothetical protein ABI428_38855, partial [Pseudomonas aeruginosa]
EQPWEEDFGKPERIVTALDIMTEGPLGGAAFILMKVETHNHPTEKSPSGGCGFQLSSEYAPVPDGNRSGPFRGQQSSDPLQNLPLQRRYLYKQRER